MKKDWVIIPIFLRKYASHGVEMIRVLQVLSSLESGGGVQQLLLNFYSHMDRTKIHFDFIVHENNKGALEPIFESYGSKIFHVMPKKTSLKQNLAEIESIIRDNRYDIMHCHQGFTGFFALRIAKKHCIPVRISHVHQGFFNESVLKRIRNFPFRILLKHYSTQWLACSYLAGEWSYGKNALKNKKFKLIHNAIEMERFAFCENKRKITRKSLGVEDKFVIGNVARFSKQKNHIFLIKIFEEIYRKEKNAVLLLSGQGELENSIKEYVQELGLSDVVLFLGNRNDVPVLMQAFDLFLLPSLFEGLPIVLIEAQAAGLFSIVADTITKELNVTGLTEYISLNKSPEYWAEEVLKHQNGQIRKNSQDEIKNAGYDINLEADVLSTFYQNLVC